MAESIDGKGTLAEQESAIQFKEAKGYRLKSLKSGKGQPPTNTASFDRLPIGEVPDLFTLALEAVPDGEKEVWSGTIYVEGELKKAAAYRVPE
jgi:hypothetical protein